MKLRLKLEVTSSLRVAPKNATTLNQPQCVLGADQRSPHRLSASSTKRQVMSPSETGAIVALPAVAGHIITQQTHQEESTRYPHSRWTTHT